MGKSISHQNIYGYLEDAASSYPHETAIVSAKIDDFESKSFKQLRNEVILCSNYLRTKGLNKHDKVLLAVRPGYQLIVITFAIFQIGAIPVIIDPGMGISSFLKCVKNTRPKALIGVPLIHLLSKFFPKAFKSVEKKVVVRNHSLIRKIGRYPNSPAQKQTSEKNESLAAIVFTSGSTGPPKGVCYTHKMFNAQINHLKNDFGFEHGEKDLSTLPIFALFNPALGVTSVIPDMNPRKPANANSGLLVKAMQEFEINTAFASPIIGKKIYDYCKSNNLSLPHVKRLLLAGAPTNPTLVKNLSQILPNGNVILPYGATEALPLTSVNQFQIKKLKEDICNGKGSCLGKPLNGNIIKIMPITSSPFGFGDNCPVELDNGTVGEISVSGSVVSQKYFRMPGATVDSKFNDGKRNYHRMGDLGYIDDNGFLRFLGRKAERVMTVNGPLETERCEPLINEINGISRSALIGIGKGTNQKPCIVVELEDGKQNKNLIKNEILQLLDKKMPTFNFNLVVFEKKLPVDSRHNAKIHRLSLSKKWTRIIEKKQF